MKTHPAIIAHMVELYFRISLLPAKDFNHISTLNGPDFGKDPALSTKLNPVTWRLYNIHTPEGSHGDSWGWARFFEDGMSYGEIVYGKKDECITIIAGVPYGGTTLPPRYTDTEIVRTMLGSFSYTWKFLDVQGNSAKVKYRVYNRVSRESASPGGIVPNVTNGIWANQYQYIEFIVTIHF